MTKMISTASGFQSSVNIAYDLNDDKKLKNYIPTKSALRLLNDILMSTRPDSAERARILIGAYGKGKSHIVLMILSILAKKDLALFEKMMPVVKRENPELYALIQNYYGGSRKLLPVVITGSNNSLSQAFMTALQRTLIENELDDIMPESGYKAAVNVIDMWKKDYPATFDSFCAGLDEDIEAFEQRLLDFDPSAYETFENLYPSMTAGSVFNPFIGFGVIEVYEEVIRGLKSNGYTGIYIVYDEFSKYLENHISESTKNDTKILQDLAEKCNRSENEELHLMLISHKEITSYLDRTSKQIVDGWRGVSERFIHVYLNNNFSQTYEVIASAIQKDEALWETFCREHKKDFESLESRYKDHPIFADLYDAGVDEVIRSCYPLHPVSTFILPRLSERVAQNERTLFTFISAPAKYTLYSFLESYGDQEFRTVTPDVIYDYFEPLLKQEVYSGSLHQYYFLTTTILRHLEEQSLESRIVKALSVTYILEQFEKLAPTKDELVGIYSVEYSPEEIQKAVQNLIEEKYVVYLKRSNNYLRLKDTSGVDVRAEIEKLTEKQAGHIDLKKTLNEANFNNYLFPSRYNDDKDMTRYFAFQFINAEEAIGDVNWKMKSERIKADGVIFAVFPESDADIVKAKQAILQSSIGQCKNLFVIPTTYKDIAPTIREYEAVKVLRDAAEGDQVLFEDYDIVYEDLRDIIQSYIADFTQPERNRASFVYNGNEVFISRKTALTGLLSDICDELYPHTPVIRSEVINRDELTANTSNSRNKIIAALLRNDLEPNLGLTGTGQEVSIMRSTLVRTGILQEHDGIGYINLEPDDSDLRYMFSVIRKFIESSKDNPGVSFDVLYEQLETEKMHLGIRKGPIPIYLAAVFHEYKRELIIADSVGEVPITMDTVVQLNASPSLFTLSFMEWDSEKESYVAGVGELFKEYLEPDPAGSNSYESVQRAMRRWYMNLPKYAKNLKQCPNGEKIGKEARKFIQEFRKNVTAYELLFNDVPAIYGTGYTDATVEGLKDAKAVFDTAMPELIQYLHEDVKSAFMPEEAGELSDDMSLTSVVKDWVDTLPEEVFEQLFTDGTDRCLTVFRQATNDSEELLKNLGKVATGLRIADWDAETVEKFKAQIRKYKKTAENFVYDQKEKAQRQGNGVYQLSYIDGEGHTVIKKFDKVEESKRGRLLHNSIVSQIKAMGQSISDQEKRQILMEVLKGLC